ncbi:MAG TPA: hypothetical protein DCE41_09035 [Cytophagales bacterium]|nr:hypothetical protein [Cytophagales bacterium]HAA23969.1 hypothetical protein [Cytophagales bacterium]HAP58367.1 hypothetical protein [Cytophagales bacterium]
MNKLLFVLTILIGISPLFNAQAQDQSQSPSKREYPVPEGVKASRWRVLKQQWGYRARFVEVIRQDRTVQSGFLLGAYPEGITFLEGESLPFVSAAAMNVITVAPQDIDQVLVKPLGYPFFNPLLQSAAVGTLTSGAWLATQGVDEYAGWLLVGIAAGGLALPGIGLGHVLWFSKRNVEVGGSLTAYAKLQHQLRWFTQVPNLAIAQTLPQYAPEDPADPYTYQSLYPIMPRLAKAWRPRKWAVSVASGVPLYSGLNGLYRDGEQVGLWFPQTTRPDYVYQLGLSFHPNARWSVGADLVNSRQYRYIGSPESTYFTNAFWSSIHDLEVTSFRMGVDYYLVASDPLLAQRHAVGVGASLGLDYVDLFRAQSSAQTYNNSRVQLYRPAIQVRATHQYALTRFLYTKVALGFNTSIPYQVEALSLPTDVGLVNLPADALDFSMLTGMVGLSYRF